jgi:hypothetical protein
MVALADDNDIPRIDGSCGTHEKTENSVRRINRRLLLAGVLKKKAV